jgi:hypothetical protein
VTAGAAPSSSLPQEAAIKPIAASIAMIRNTGRRFIIFSPDSPLFFPNRKREPAVQADISQPTGRVLPNGWLMYMTLVTKVAVRKKQNYELVKTTI